MVVRVSERNVENRTAWARAHLPNRPTGMGCEFGIVLQRAFVIRWQLCVYQQHPHPHLVRI